uniref:Glycosyl transferase family 25 domain-containing protein n=1 Tax=viral metagenome TaxID=1070528 RepID=A0A6C0DTC8_9ZZZZ
MAKIRRPQIFITALFIAIAVGTVAIYYLIPRSSRPTIDDIWVVNLDKATDRLDAMMEKQRFLPKPIQRWPATLGREESRDSAAADGVDPVITKSSDKETMKRTNKVTRIGGEVGCWLSHKRLLKHLNTLNVGPDFGHLICEDDIVVPTDFISKWNTTRQHVPCDWDVVYIGAGGPLGDRINESVLRWKSEAKLANLGTWCYLVRHRALPKILEKMRYMFAPVDVQYYRTFGDLKVYIMEPSLLKPNESYESTTDRH